MAYHSNLLSDKVIGNLAILPVKTKVKGPATMPDDATGHDIIDEALYYFKANVFFQSYEIKNETDRLFIHLTLFISECLKKLAKCGDKNQATQEIYKLAVYNVSIPGELGFGLKSIFAKPSSSSDAGKHQGNPNNDLRFVSEFLRSYLTQVRQECGQRVCTKVFFNTEDGKPSKWWISFAKRKFIG
ncbi:Actin-related protein 2/3 complex subunit 3 [Orchesella cincta]|uniref:Actin-related protein 2/3 complex subunit 3 n=1 Tax=Orchesella cincta TaxID=48709 RepID=A0A1D2MD80_ORCCI|nr:Actin-related protein 2/3 complex subunit 3 [Orchesella cincta]